MSDPRHRQWLEEAISQCPSGIQDDARELLKPFLRTCRSNSRHRFWIALRLFMVKPQNECEDLLEFVSESKCAPEVENAEPQRFRCMVNGDVALIDVEDGDANVIWKIPVDKLEWAQSLYPVRLKQLRNGRYAIVKYMSGKEYYVHRLYLNADGNVFAHDGDFTNYTTTKIRVVRDVVAQEDSEDSKRVEPTAWVCGDRYGSPEAWTKEEVVPNLYVGEDDGIPDIYPEGLKDGAKSGTLMAPNHQQQKFDAGMLQTKNTPQGDIDESPLKVQPNQLESWVKAGVDKSEKDREEDNRLETIQLEEEAMLEVTRETS